MGRTTAAAEKQGRRHVAILVMALTTVVALAGPAATAIAGEAGSVAADTGPITLMDLRQMVEEFEATGEVTAGGAARLGATLSLAELYDRRGFDSRTILALELFKDTADDPVRIPSESARQALIAAANQVIVQLGGTIE